MTLTPWGDSSALRARKLAPGFRLPPASVARNQRWRLMAAMLARVAERGYAGTTIADVTKLSGVSRTSFYDHFANKEACFLATVDASVDFALEAMQAAHAEAEDDEWDAQLLATLDALVREVVAQPAAARVCLLETHVAGRTAVEHARAGTVAFERVVRAGFQRSPAQAGLPPAIAQGIGGGVQKVLFTNLRLGTEERLPELVPALADWALSYRNPGVAIRRARARPALPVQPPPEQLDPVDRIFAALLAVVHEKGYGAMTLDDVAERSAISFSTFYRHFGTKEEAFLAAYDTGIFQTFAAALPAFQEAPDWPQGVRAGLAAALGFVARETGWAYLGLVEVLAAGKEGMERRDNGLATFQTLLQPGFELKPKLPPVVGEAVSGAIFHVLGEHVRLRGAERAPELLPVLTFLALAPFVGSEQAATVANQRTRRRAPRLTTPG